MEIPWYLELSSLINLFGAFVLTSILYFLKRNKTKLKREWCASLFNGPSTIPLFGNALNFILHPESIPSMLNYYTHKYGSKYRLWIGQKLCIVLADATWAENVLMNHKLLNKGDDFRDLFGRVFKNGTFATDGASWKKSRKILQHPLKTNVLENYVGIMNEEIDKVVKELSTKVKTKEIFDISDYLAPAVFMILCRTLYDLKEPISTEEISMFRDKTGEFLADSFNLMFYPKIIRDIANQINKKRTKINIKSIELAYRRVILEDKLKADENESSVNDESINKFIQYLLSDAFSDEDKKSEIITYSVGGSETLIITLSFAFLLLAMHTDIQDKVYEEQEYIFEDSDREVTVNDIKRMNYLNQVLKEVMRLFPLVPFIFRTSQEDITLGDLTLPANTQLIINIAALQRDPKYFPNPDTFDPEHFSQERCEQLPKGCYLPFVIGPRNCIGKAYAMYEMKIICSAILRKYRLHTTLKKEDIKLRHSFVISSANGYNISISERSK